MVALLVLAVASSATLAAVPPDVLGRTCAGDVEKLQGLGIIGGYPDGTFKPDNPIKRSEISKIIVVARKQQGLADLMKGAPTFSDVPTAHWASGFIAVAKNNGIVGGYPGGLFKPEDYVTYAETLAMLLRAVGRSPNEGTWPTNVLTAAASLDVTTGLTFDAGSPASRGDVAIMASRVVFGVTDPTTGKCLADAFDQPVKAFHKITVMSSPVPGGNVIGGGTYVNGSATTVTAVAAHGYKFAKWVEGSTTVCTNSAYVFNVAKDRTLGAVFPWSTGTSAIRYP